MSITSVNISPPNQKSPLTWIHVGAPTYKEITKLNEKEQFHEIILEDLRELNSENKVDYYEDERVVSISLNFPKYKKSIRKYVLNACILIVEENKVISVSRFNSSHIQLLQEQAKKGSKKWENSFDIAYDIIDIMYDKSIRGLGKASREIVSLQESVMYSNTLQKTFLENLMNKKINMIILQHIFRPQREVLHEIKKNMKRLYNHDQEEKQEIRLYVDDLDAKLDKIINTISVMFETARSLTDTYNSLMNVQTNTIITILTIFTAATGIMAVIV